MNCMYIVLIYLFTGTNNSNNKSNQLTVAWKGYQKLRRNVTTAQKLSSRETTQLTNILGVILELKNKLKNVPRTYFIQYILLWFWF